MVDAALISIGYDLSATLWIAAKVNPVNSTVVIYETTLLTGTANDAHAMIRVYKLPELRRYSSTIKSAIFALDAAVVLSLIIIPVVIAHFTYEFYVRTFTYSETPTVRFVNKLSGLMATNGSEIYITTDRIVALDTTNFRTPTLRYAQSERSPVNTAGSLRINIEVPLNPAEDVYAITFVLTFDIQLGGFTMAAGQVDTVVSLDSQRSVSGLDYVGDLSVRQNDVLPTLGKLEFSKKGLPSTHKDPVTKIYSAITPSHKSAIYGVLTERSHQWNPANSKKSSFLLSATIMYQPFRLCVRPGFWFTIKYAWIQYVSLALLFFYLGEKIRIFVYCHQWVRSKVTTTLPSLGKRKEE
ncbi:unnamed protein product [Calicophoron daubneyi]|uniref:Transmembrane protein 231 n=1 Tax=Calicophoron daubneyi TaxID=300641 RepID=A0AAV2TFK0_CALDB